jgi:hypothetical protein
MLRCNAKHNKVSSFFLTVHLDILCNENQPDVLFYPLFISLNNLLDASGMFIALHQDVFTVYVQQLIRCIRLR